MRCLICRSTSLREIYIKIIKRDGFLCKKCSFVFLWPQPSATELKILYGPQYYQSWGVSEHGFQDSQVKQIKGNTFRPYIQTLKQYVPQGAFLDIGCAFGHAMEVAENVGYDVYGVELSSFSATIAQKKFPVRVIEGSLGEGVFQERTFNVVTLFDVLEHVEDPVVTLQSVRDTISEDGIVMITTPNRDSLSYRLLRGKWFHWKLEHLGYFNKKSLQTLAQKTGFNVVSIGIAYKRMTIHYLYYQFRNFPHPVFTPIFKILNMLLPEKLKNLTFPVSGGEMVVVLKPKKDEV